MKLTIISVGLAVVFGSTAAFAAITETVDAAKGKIVAAADCGMTLYTFRKDTVGKSACCDACAANWPPFLADEADEGKAEGDLTLIERTNGTYQWAMKGMPLYFFAGDAAKSDANGDGVKGVWDVVHPN